MGASARPTTPPRPGAAEDRNPSRTTTSQPCRISSTPYRGRPPICGSGDPNPADSGVGPITFPASCLVSASGPHHGSRYRTPTAAAAMMMTHSAAQRPAFGHGTDLGVTSRTVRPRTTYWPGSRQCFHARMPLARQANERTRQQIRSMPTRRTTASAHLDSCPLVSRRPRRSAGRGAWFESPDLARRSQFASHSSTSRAVRGRPAPFTSSTNGRSWTPVDGRP
jgi:hypothetical protein